MRICTRSPDAVFKGNDACSGSQSCTEHHIIRFNPNPTSASRRSGLERVFRRENTWTCICPTTQILRPIRMRCSSRSEQGAIGEPHIAETQSFDEVRAIPLLPVPRVMHYGRSLSIRRRLREDDVPGGSNPRADLAVLGWLLVPSESIPPPLALRVLHNTRAIARQSLSLLF